MRSRGLWFDSEKQKWRVRLYRNGRAYLPKPKAYFDTEEEARAVYAALKEELSKIPKRRKTTVPLAFDLHSAWMQCHAAAQRARIELVIRASAV